MGRFGSSFRPSRALQEVKSLGFQLYTGYRNYDLNVKGLSLDDIHVVSTGASVFFDATSGPL